MGMFKKTVTFEDLDGNPITEDFYFNLSIPEITKIQFSVEGGFGEMVEKIMKSGDGAKIMDFFETLITKSIGKKGADNIKFEKSQEIVDYFMQSNAYEVMFTELCTNAEAGAAFFNGLMPSDEKMREFIKNANTSEVVTDGETPAWIKENREPTKEELMKMTPDQLRQLYASKAGASKED